MESNNIIHSLVNHHHTDTLSPHTIQTLDQHAPLAPPSPINNVQMSNHQHKLLQQQQQQKQQHHQQPQQQYPDSQQVQQIYRQQQTQDANNINSKSVIHCSQQRQHHADPLPQHHGVVENTSVNGSQVIPYSYSWMARRVYDTTQHYQQLVKVLQSKEIELETYRENKKYLRTELEETQQKYLAQEQSTKKLNDELSSLKNQTVPISQYEEVVQQRKEILESINKLTTQNEILLKEAEQNKEELTKLNTENEEFFGDNFVLHQKNSELEEKIKQFMEKDTETKIDTECKERELRVKSCGDISQFKVLKGKLVSSSDVNYSVTDERIRKRLKELQLAKKALKRQVQETSSMIKSLEEDLNEQKALVALQKECLASSKIKIMEMEDMAKGNDSKLIEQNEKIHRQQTRIRMLVSDLKDMTDENFQLKRDLDQRTQIHEKNLFHYNKLSQKLEEKSDKVAKLQDDIINLEDSIFKYKGETIANRSRINELVGKRAELTAKLKSFQGLTKKCTKLVNLQQQNYLMLQEKDETISNLNAHVTSLEKSLKKNQEINKKLTNKLKRYESESRTSQELTVKITGLQAEKKMLESIMNEDIQVEEIMQSEDEKERPTPAKQAKNGI